MNLSTKVNVITAVTVATIFLGGFTYQEWRDSRVKLVQSPRVDGCVFKTVMGEDVLRKVAESETPQDQTPSVKRALEWLVKAQQADGGWGAGSHARQDVIDPHSVPTDAATTAMAGMALLRSGNMLTEGDQHSQLHAALEYILTKVESNTLTNTGKNGQTQIQMKLGQNIDVVLAAQFLSNVMDQTQGQSNDMQRRIRSALATCVQQIETNVEQDGSMRGAGWAGVLQSSFAINALESAQKQGVDVSSQILKSARDHQKGNYDPKTGAVNTERGAGVMLYSVTGSVRGVATEAGEVKEAMRLAKKKKRIAQNAAPDAQTLQEIGYSQDEAIRYSTSYEVYESAKEKSKNDDVMTGFGSNGGEEFLSYLQTGESLIIGKDDSWQEWYRSMSDRLLSIQQNDGSWRGHHCITSPVFCTATCVLVLNIKNDFEKLSR